MDGLLRKPLANELPAASVVFWEHVIIVLLLVPLLPSALRAFARAAPREQLALVLIGVGASAVATALFTAAFRLGGAVPGGAVTPLVLQKLQPVFAVLAAYLLLRERLRPAYFAFAVPALAGGWLLAFDNPLSVKVTAAKAALLALGAAALWAGGTVLGRMVAVSLAPRDVMVLRFVFGLPAAAVVLSLTHARLAVGWDNAPGLVLLAIIPGLLALSLYYVGLRATPASRATLAELAFPVTAALVGVGLLDNRLTWTQWLGFAIVVTSVTALGWHERVRGRTRPVVLAPPQPVRI
jgi:drug/metabolite transporter (DMT)-like permease